MSGTFKSEIMNYVFYEITIITKILPKEVPYINLSKNNINKKHYEKSYKY